MNVALILVGGLLGILLGDRLKERTKTTVTAVLGLFVIVLGGMSVVDMGSAALAEAAGPFAMIVILLSLVFGALLGSGCASRIGSRGLQSGCAVDSSPNPTVTAASSTAW